MNAAEPNPPTYGKPEPRHWAIKLLKAMLVLAGLAIIGWLISIAKPMKPLVCDSKNASLTQFGTCHEE